MPKTESAGATVPNAAAQETAARLSALLRHLFLYDRGNMLRAIEESGLSTTQTKVLLELGGLGEEAEPRQVSDLAEAFGASVPAMSRAVDCLVKEGLVTRVECSNVRRVRLVGITAKGKRLVAKLVVIRQAGLEAFTESLDEAQRRKLDDAIDALMDRDDIAVAFRHLKEVKP